MKRLMMLLLALAAPLASLCEGANERVLMGVLMRMELAEQVVEQARKMSDLPEVAEAADRFHEQLFDRAREALLGAYEDEDAAQNAFAGFVDDASADTGKYGALRGKVAKGELASEVAAAGRFLGEVQSWLRLREKEKGDVPTLQTWLERDSKPKAKKKKKKQRNSLKDAEAEAGDFIEAPDDGGSVLGTFDTSRRLRRQKAQSDAELGLSQVSDERRIADEEYNAKRQAAAAAEAAAMQAHAQRLAAAEQEAIDQDLNSWRTRVKEMVSSGVGAAGSAFFGTIGTRAGERAARAVIKPKRDRR